MRHLCSLGLGPVRTVMSAVGLVGTLLADMRDKPAPLMGWNPPKFEYEEQD